MKEGDDGENIYCLNFTVCEVDWQSKCLFRIGEEVGSFKTLEGALEYFTPSTCIIPSLGSLWAYDDGGEELETFEYLGHPHPPILCLKDEDGVSIKHESPYKRERIIPHKTKRWTYEIGEIE